MSVAFWSLAALMVLAALAFVLVPLLRHAPAADDHPAPAQHAPAPAPMPALLVLALLLPLATWLLYRQVGEPRALQPEAHGTAATSSAAPAIDGAAAPTLEEATAALAERMRETPDDLGGWMLLGRAYKSMQRFDDARDALANAYRVAPENVDVAVEYAEALTLASDSRRIEGQAAELLDGALARQPTHERGLWLKGIQAYQAGDFAAAAATWERLRASLQPNAPVHAALAERIADARAQAGLPAAAPASATDAPAAAAAAAAAAADATAAGAPRLQVLVDIAPELKARLAPTDVLFVYARAAEGPRVPVAIQRLPAAQFPLTVTLDDSTSMLPQMTLSSLPEVVVGARVSHSGNAIPQPGDFEVVSAPVRSDRREPLPLLVDRIVE